MADLRRAARAADAASQVQRGEVIDKISVTEEEAQAYYDAHKQEFTTPSEVTLREILIEVPATERGVNVAQDDAAKAKAEDDPEAPARRRAVPAAGRRSVRRAVEGQRRADRPDQARRAGGGAAEDARNDEGRRRHRSAAHASAGTRS